MKLRRTWPAIGIWAIFLIFDIVMVTSLGFFLGLFPSDRALIYSGVLAGLSILVMSVITFLLGKLSDRLQVAGLKEKVVFRIIYSCLAVLIIAAGVYYRVEILSGCSGDVIGKYSLYENAMVGNSAPTEEYDLLSIVYSAVLKAILFFTGNIISVPFLFQIACFTIFMICGFFTVKKLLGPAASIVFTSYVAFMPVFTYKFTGLELSTDSLFMAMFGIELLVMALFLQGAYRKIYKHPAFVVWYILVGIVVGFMAYVDAGTIIMILPFILAVLFIKGTSFREEIVRLLFVLFGAAFAFAGMIVQEQGFMMAYPNLLKWSGFYFHNLNTFSMFWTYTDHKIAYLVTAVAMSGVMVGFWKNRNFEKISPWLVSMLLIFATVPFMGATRMNTQVFVTVYYAFILACVADLITTPADETKEDVAGDAEVKKKRGNTTDSEEPSEEGYAATAPEVITPEFSEHEPQPWQRTAEHESEELTREENTGFYDDPEPKWRESDPSTVSKPQVKEPGPFNDFDPVWRDSEPVNAFEPQWKEPRPSYSSEPQWKDSRPSYSPAPEAKKNKLFDDFDPLWRDAKPANDSHSDWHGTDMINNSVPVWKEPEPELRPEPEPESAAEPIQDAAEEHIEPAAEPVPEVAEEHIEPAEEPEEEHVPQNAEEPDRVRFVPEGMVLPEDDEDADLAPRMKMPQLSAPVGPDGNIVKLKVGGNSALTRQDKKEDKPRDDFDIAFTPGDDFDI